MMEKEGEDMKLVVEQRSFDLPFERVGVLGVRQDGTCGFPVRMRGQISAFFAKRFIREEILEGGDAGAREYRHGSICVRVEKVAT